MRDRGKSQLRLIASLDSLLPQVLEADSQEYYDKFTAEGPDTGPGWGSAVRRISAVRRLSQMGRQQGTAAAPAAPASKPPG